MEYLCSFSFSGTALKCWECNSKYDSRCGDPFSNFSVALVDCDQKHDDVDHLIEGYTEDDAGEPKAMFCRKTFQTGKKNLESWSFSLDQVLRMTGFCLKQM